MRPCIRCKRALVVSGLCASCQARDEGVQARQDSRYDRRRGSSTARGYDRRWRTYRRSYLQGHPLCVRCQSVGMVSVATEVDHIKPVVDGQDDPGFWVESNHQGLCKSCHSRKTMKENR